MEKDYFYIFLDSNAVYVKSLDYNIFSSNVLKNLIKVRNSYNSFFRETKEITLIFPEIIVRERYKQEITKIKMELEKFRRTIKRLEEPALIAELNKVIDQVEVKIIREGDEFLKTNKIEQIPSDIEEFIQDIIIKKIENLKPFSIVEKDEKKYEKGFLDAVIWYSILNYIKKKFYDSEALFPVDYDDIHVIFLSNDKDFRSKDLENEFFNKTGIKINIISYENCANELSDQNFNKLLRKILSDTYNNKIDLVRIYYTQLRNEIFVNSIYPLPLDINMLSFLPIQKTYAVKKFQKEFSSDLAKIVNELKNLGFDLFSFQTEFLETKISNVIVVLRDYKSQFLDILEINLYFADGSEKTIEDIEMEISIFEYEEATDLRIEKEIANILGERGFKNIDPRIIDLDVQEYVTDPD